MSALPILDYIKQQDEAPLREQLVAAERRLGEALQIKRATDDQNRYLRERIKELESELKRFKDGFYSAQAFIEKEPAI